MENTIDLISILLMIPNKECNKS